MPSSGASAGPSRLPVAVRAQVDGAQSLRPPRRSGAATPGWRNGHHRRSCLLQNLPRAPATPRAALSLCPPHLRPSAIPCMHLCCRRSFAALVPASVLSALICGPGPRICVAGAHLRSCPRICVVGVHLRPVCVGSICVHLRPVRVAASGSCVCQRAIGVTLIRVSHRAARPRALHLPPSPDWQHAAAGDRPPVSRASTADLRQVRVAQPDRQHQGPDGALHPRAGLPRAAHPARRPHRRGHQRQHRHLVRGDRPRARASGHDLHAGLDERRAHGAHRELRRRDRAGQSRAQGGFLGSIALARGAGASATRTCSCRVSSRTRPTSRRTARRTGPEIWLQLARRRPGAGRVRRRRRHRRHGDGRGARSCVRARRRCAFTRSSRRSRRRCPPATRWASTASRASPTSSSRRSSSSTSSTRSWPCTTATRS